MTTPFLGFTVREKACWAVSGDGEESETWSLKLNCPEALAVPAMVPPLANVKPDGNAPDTSVNLYGEVPPVTCTVAEYATPTVALGKLLIEN